MDSGFFEKVNGEFDNFKQILDDIMSMLKDELPKLDLTEEKIQAILVELEENRKKKNTE